MGSGCGVLRVRGLGLRVEGSGFKIRIGCVMGLGCGLSRV
jgi:hypothetical protein